MGVHLLFEVASPIIKEQLSILRANQAIYDGLPPASDTTLSKSISFSFSMRGYSFIPGSWGHRKPTVSYKEHKFGEIPFDQANLVIHLCAPDPTDPSQLLLIYRKARRKRTYWPPVWADLHVLSFSKMSTFATTSTMTSICIVTETYMKPSNTQVDVGWTAKYIGPISQSRKDGESRGNSG